jgi:23S rRNA (uracil1939-C5)-methyltransferase
MTRELVIDHLGHKGDGVAPGPIFVPYALPGERVQAEIAGDRAVIVAVETTSPDRVAPFCPYFGTCGGCTVQHLAEGAYARWKRGLVTEALSLARIETSVAPLIGAHGAGRRRATLHARRGRLGFAMARSHEIVEIETCPIVDEPLAAALPAARAIERLLRGVGKPLDILMTATRTGVDIDLRGSGPVAGPLRLKLSDLAVEQDLARLSLHADVVLEQRPPTVRFGRADVTPPPGAFLQATEAGDKVLAGLVQEGVGQARRVADLYSGCGTLSFPLAETATVTAIDSDRAATSALDRAARLSRGLKPIRTEVRDLFRRPLMPDELKAYDAVVFDPPRAGAEAQARRLAQSKVPTIVGVSCNPATFARDAAILIAGGYRLTKVTPVDQFRHSAHVELVGLFTR